MNQDKTIMNQEKTIILACSSLTEYVEAGTGQRGNKDAGKIPEPHLSQGPR